MHITQQEGEELRTQVRGALGAHYLWMARLRAAAKYGSTEFDANDVRHDDRCSIGHWLAHDIPRSLTYSEHFLRSKDLHRQFHEEIANVIRLIQRNNLVAARAALEPQGDCGRVARDLEHALKDWMVVGLSARTHGVVDRARERVLSRLQAS